MSVNLLTFINNLTEVEEFSLTDIYSGSNRINNVGEALELFVKDVLCESLSIEAIDAKQQKHAEQLSYLGNQNNPPDFIIKNGDAFEVKKLINTPNSIALNSSYPKSKLRRDDSKISQACREVDGGNWSEKDLVYVVGSVDETKLKTLWLVYGDCYAADKETYEAPLNQISTHLESLPNIEVADTNEISRLNKVDPLGLTYLRVRGMWGIDAPHKVFASLVSERAESDFSAHTLMLTEKYQSFSPEDIQQLETNPKITITPVEIPSPNNPATYLSATLISFSV